MKNIQLSPLSLVAGSAATAGLFLLTGMQSTSTAEPLFTLTPEQAEILSHQSIVYLDDGQGGTVKTLRISGINVQIVNGMGSTETMNGLGNLTVGYNEMGNPDGDDRTGSHNIVGGWKNTHGAWGGLVVGSGNTVTGVFSSVSGGRKNTASGLLSSVSGGRDNTASGASSSISGGRLNTASGNSSSVSGGLLNTASGYYSSVTGGWNNAASGNTSSVSGGLNNMAINGGYYSYGASVSGGSNNTAGGDYYSSGASVSGGANRTAPGDYDWVAGSLFEDN